MSADLMALLVSHSGEKHICTAELIQPPRIVALAQKIELTPLAGTIHHASRSDGITGQPF